VNENIGFTQSTVKFASDTSDVSFHTESLAVILILTVLDSINGVVQLYNQSFASFSDITVQFVQLSVEYLSVIGFTKRESSVIDHEFHNIFIEAFHFNISVQFG